MIQGRAKGGTTGKVGSRLPGLDGLRALAVLAVIAFHEQLTAFPGGFLGVDVFFVLSGYLITDLLVAQWNRHGRLDLRGFWARRARRLLPALAAMLVTVTAVTAIIEPGQLATLRQALIAAVTYSSNWWQAMAHRSYFAQFGPPPPLQHLWSLAIEEQFYLVWPLFLIVVLATCQSSRVRASLAWLCAALSAVAMALIYVPGGDPSRVYYGTDTHASALFIGSALALSWPLRRLQAGTREKAQVADAFGLAGIALLSWSMGHFAGGDSALYPAGLLIAALAAGAVVLAAASPGVVGWLLGWPPLRWIGIRSYGIYLWHWPVIALTAAIMRQQPPGVLIWAAEAVISVGLAAASWRWIEQPILRDGFGATVRARYRLVTRSLAVAHRSPARVFPAVALVAAVAVACTAGYGVLHARSSSGLAKQISQGVRISQQGSSGQAGPALAANAGHAAPSPNVPAATPTPAAPGTPDPAAPGTGPAPARVSSSAVTAIGDSVMLAAAPQLESALPGISIDAQVSRQVSVGLSIAAQLAATGALRPIVVFALGTNGTFATSQVRQLLAAIGPHRKLVLVNTYEARPWQDGNNQVIAAAARQHANVVVANWFAAIEHRTDLLWPDEVHPQPPGARLYAHTVAAAVRAVSSAGTVGQAGHSLPPPLPRPIRPLP
ncbi:MAG TPA: acyltransferase family protein [Streptosporangiaceae bacterium]|nr:acyltransferase family protein [Streptosporangiaceae bacterium]